MFTSDMMAARLRSLASCLLALLRSAAARLSSAWAWSSSSAAAAAASALLWPRLEGCWLACCSAKPCSQGLCSECRWLQEVLRGRALRAG